MEIMLAANHATARIADMSQTIPVIDDIVRAAETLLGHAVRTPLLRSPALDALTGGEVFVKPENLQKTGSFKFRGAYNAISNLDDAQRKRGVVALSSGNHAQGVGEAARLFGVAATIVMPSDAPASKITRTLASGAEVIHFDRENDDRDAVVARVVADKDAVFIHPFNNPMVIAGQGTVGLEIADDLAALGKKADRVLICTGGGGLTAGVALAIHARFPEAIIHTVEPEGFDDYRRSLEAGEILENELRGGSVCDAILSSCPGTIGFEVNRKLISQGLVVSDSEALEAVRFAYEELKLVVEPGGAVALAAVLQLGRKCEGETVALVLSGGNVDPAIFAAAIKG